MKSVLSGSVLIWHSFARCGPASELIIHTITARAPPSLFLGTRCIERTLAGSTSMSERCLKLMQKFSLIISFGCTRKPSMLILHFCENSQLMFAMEMVCRTSLAAVVIQSTFFCSSFFFLCNFYSYICLYSKHHFFLYCSGLVFYQHVLSLFSPFRI